MSKFKPYSRRRFNRRIREWGIRNRRNLAVLIAGFLLLVGFETALVVGLMPHTPFTWWFLGVIQAGMVAACVQVLQLAFLAHDREAVVQLRGAWGEDNTRSELQKARRRRHLWGWVDSIQLQGSDIDHLVVTRRGGLVAIDTKWRSQGNDVAEMARSARRAATRAEGLVRSVMTQERGARHRSKVNPMRVTPVVVVWGAAQRAIPAGYRAEEVAFIPGGQLVSWLAALDTQAVAKLAARDLIARLKEYRAGNWDTNAHV